MNIYYLNDESTSVTIRLIARDVDATNIFVELKPQEGRIFTIDAPEGSIPFVKRWDNRTILLSYMVLPSTVHI